MIVKVEKHFETAFSSIQISGLDSLKYGFGDSLELDRILVMRGENNKKNYPLLWYVMPNKLNYNYGSAQGTFKFVLAHNSTLDWLNDQRFDNVFDTVLFPYAEEVFAAIDKSGNISRDSKDFKFTNMPNYTDATLNKTEQVEYWDAIVLEMDLRIQETKDC